MVEIPVDPPQRPTAAPYPYLAPILRHAGWFGFFLILAPEIGPRGYGVFMVALSVVAIVEGLLAQTAAAVIEKFAKLDELHWSTALVTLMSIGAALSLCLSTGAGWVGALFDHDGTAEMVRSLAVLPLLGALAVVPTAALRREARSIAPVAASAAGLAAGGGIAVALAWAGAGPWSLVAQIVVQRLVECTVLWAIPGERIGLGWSRRHFVAFAGAVDRRALASGGLAAARYMPYLLVGLTLGPSATGLYMLVSHLSAALIELPLAGSHSASARESVERGCRVVLPAILASCLLAIAVPPVLDPRWWGAVLPAQLLVLGALPAALIYVRGAWGQRSDEALRWRVILAFGGVAVTALVVSQGLVALAAAQLVWVAAVALAGLWPLRRVDGMGWRVAIRPCAGGAAAGALLLAIAEPVGLTLASVPALSLLIAAGWSLYLLIRGEPRGTAQPLPAPRARVGGVAPGTL